MTIHSDNCSYPIYIRLEATISTDIFICKLKKIEANWTGVRISSQRSISLIDGSQLRVSFNKHFIGLYIQSPMRMEKNTYIQFSCGWKWWVLWSTSTEDQKLWVPSRDYWARSQSLKLGSERDPGPHCLCTSCWSRLDRGFDLRCSPKLNPRTRSFPACQPTSS